MIITEEVEIRINGKNYKYYKEKGYDITQKTILVKINDLITGSNKRVDVQCDICGEFKNIKYYAYYKNYIKFNLYTCNNVECLKIKRSKCVFEKYGVNNVLELPSVIEKRNKTNIERYGVEYGFSNEMIKNKIKTTNIERYGVENPMQNIGVKNKSKATNIERYGVEYASQSDMVKNKIKTTNIERYGVESTLQSDIIKYKIKATNIERYGVENGFSNEMIKNKIKTTNIEKYGVEYASQSDIIKDKIKATNLDKYGFESALQSDVVKNKIKTTNLKKYGYENATHNIDIFNKQQKNMFLLKEYNGFKYRGTYELHFIMFCIENNINIKNSKNSIKYYTDKIHYYFPDFYLEELNLIIEIKSKYTYEKNIDVNLAKQQATINNGFDYIFIINKDYTEFLNKIKKS